ncbi:MAG TPA: hypothetical protein V6D47_04870 [Oscillatoriaceae cyanobacterium]
MTRSLSTLVLAAVALVATTGAPALAANGQTPHQHFTSAERQAHRAAWEKMTPEQRQQAMQQRIAQREATMTPEQKAQFEQKRAAWQKMTPDERQQAMPQHRAEWQQRKGQKPAQQ